MSNIEDLVSSALQEMAEPQNDERQYFVIDDLTRKITVPPAISVFAVSGDANTNRIWFKAPRYVGDHLDLAACTIRVNYLVPNGGKASFYVEDFAIDGDDVIFSWLLSRHSVTNNGTISFIVCAMIADGDGVVTDEWNTAIATATVLAGVEPDGQQLEDDRVLNVVAQVKTRAADAEAAADRAETAEDAAVTAMNKAGQSSAQAETAKKSAVAAQAAAESVRDKILQDIASVEKVKDAVEESANRAYTAEMAANAANENAENNAKYASDSAKEAQQSVNVALSIIPSLEQSINDRADYFRGTATGIDSLYIHDISASNLRFRSLTITGNSIQDNYHVGVVGDRIATFEDGIAGENLICKMYVEVSQEGEGTPSPGNIRDIVGVTDLNAYIHGVNCADVSKAVPWYCDGSHRIIQNNGMRSVIIPVKQGYTYAISQSIESTMMRWGGLGSFEAKEQPLISLSIGGDHYAAYTTEGVSVVVNNPVAKAMIVTFWRDTSNVTLEETAASLQVSVGQTASVWSPYNGDHYHIDLTTLKDEQGVSAGKQIGGMIDWARKKWVQTWKYLELTGTEVFSAHVSQPNYYHLSVGDNAYTNAKGVNNVLSNTYLGKAEYYSTDTPQAVFSVDGSRLRFYDSRYATVAEFTTFLAEQYASGNPVTVAYKLATPLSYDVDLPPITAFTCVNHLFHDANGGTYVEYKRNANASMIDSDIVAPNPEWQSQINNVGTPVMEGEHIGKYAVQVLIRGTNLLDESNVVCGYPDASTYPNIVNETSKVFKTVRIGLKSGKYTVSFDRCVNVVRAMSDSQHDQNVSVPVFTSTQNTTVFTFSISTDEMVNVSFRDSTSSSTEWAGVVWLVAGDLSIAYEPFMEKEITLYIDEPLRVGDTMDIVEGKLVRRRGKVDAGSLNWTYNNTIWREKPIYYAAIDDKKRGNSLMLCEAYKWSERNDPSELEMYYFKGYKSDKTIYICDDRYSNAKDFKLAMSGVMLEYELECPVTYDIEGREVNAFSDGYVTVVGLDTTVAPTSMVATYNQNPNTVVKELIETITDIANRLSALELNTSVNHNNAEGKEG